MLAVHIAGGRVSVVDVPRPRRRKGYALIRLLCGGVCNTDIELLRGYYSFRGIPGHEFVGEVLEAGNPALVGQRVVGEINLGCGKCEWCRGGLGRHCPRRTVLGIVQHPGAFREIIDLPETNLHVVPARVPTEHAVFVEPVAAACEILDQVRIPKDERVAVLGDGKLGLLIAQVLAAYGARVVHFGKHPEKLRISKVSGITTSIRPRGTFGYVIEATGSPDGLRKAVAMTRPRGVIIVKSTVHGEVSLDTAPVVVNEITLVGSRCGRFEPAIKLIASGKLRLDPMITARFPLADAPRAFETAAAPGAIKVLLTASTS